MINGFKKYRILTEQFLNVGGKEQAVQDITYRILTEQFLNLYALLILLILSKQNIN